MKLPPLVFVLGYAGLVPFIAGPAWLTFAPESAPDGLDRVWLAYAAMIASFMAGTFWGLALLVAEGTAGRIGVVMSAVLMISAWATQLLAFRHSLIGLAVVFVLLALAEVWRERELDPLGGYLKLRVALTVGAVLCIVWRLMLPA